MESPRVFFVKCKPRGVDAVEFFRGLRRVFLGYVAWRKGAPIEGAYDQRILSLNDKSWSVKDDVDYKDIENSSTYRRLISTQRNIVHDVRKGDYILVPALQNASLYVAKVSGPMQVEPSPAWGQDFLEYRAKKIFKISDDKPEDYVSDVVQGWQTEPWVEVAFASLPRWLTVAVFRRQSVGRVMYERDMDDGRVAKSIETAINGGNRPRWQITRDRDEVAARLWDICSPSIFEHLVVSLLQLEQQDRCWLHVGGTGDGGADGLANDESGKPVARLQCKLAWNGTMAALCTAATTAGDESSLEVTVATLSELPGDANRARTTLDGSDIVRLLLKHANRIPLALSIRVEGS